MTSTQLRHAVCLAGLIVCVLCPLITYSVVQIELPKEVASIAASRSVVPLPSGPTPVVALSADSQALPLRGDSYQNFPPASNIDWMLSRHWYAKIDAGISDRESLPIDGTNGDGELIGHDASK